MHRKPLSDTNETVSPWNSALGQVDVEGSPPGPLIAEHLRITRDDWPEGGCSYPRRAGLKGLKATALAKASEACLNLPFSASASPIRTYTLTEFGALANELDRINAVTNYNGLTLFANTSTVNNTNGDPKTAADAIDVWGTDSDAIFGANDNGASTHFNMMVGQNYTAEDVAAFNNGTALNAYDKTAENLITVQLGQMDVEALFSTDANAAPDGWTIITAWGWSNPFEFMTLGPLHTNNFGDLQGKLNTMLQLIDWRND